MTNYKLNTLIKLTEEDRKRGKCPVPVGSDVTVWFKDGDIKRNNKLENWELDEVLAYVTAYLIHSVPREPREWYIVADPKGFKYCFNNLETAQSTVSFYSKTLGLHENWEITKVREVLEENES